MASDNKLGDEIRKLEEMLLEPEVRSSPDHLGNLLADDFLEFGSSGRVFDRKDIIDALTALDVGSQYSVQNFKLRNLSDDVVLVTYKLEAILEPGNTTKRTLRSSIWKRKENGWKMIFHQGTLI